MNRILKPAAFVIVAIYFVLDAAFSCVTTPLVNWIGRQRVFGKVRGWIVSLRPYSALALFAVPVIVLEPVKPVAAYFMPTGHLVFGLGTLIGGGNNQAHGGRASLPAQSQKTPVHKCLCVGIRPLAKDNGLDRILESLAGGPSYQRENHAGPSQPYRATKGFAAVAPTFMAILFEFGERILILQSPMDAIRLDGHAWGKKEAQIGSRLGRQLREALAWINAGTTFVHQPNNTSRHGIGPAASCSC